MDTFIFITGFIALVSTFINFFFDNKKIILLIQCVTLIFYSAHIFLLWWIASAWLLLLMIARNIFFAHDFSRILQTIGLLILLWINFYIYFQNRILDPLSHFSLLGAVLWTFWCWVKNTTAVRLLFFASTLPWIYYVIQIWSPFAIILQLVFMLSIWINIVRFDILKQNNKLT